MRIDKWLWAVRVFKTRTLAAESIRAGHVRIGGETIKPSREVRLDEIVTAQIGPMTRTLKVVGLLEQRVGAKLVPNYATDLTPPEEYEKKREPNLQPLMFRPKGSGRPTKKDRRQMREFFE